MKVRRSAVCGGIVGAGDDRRLGACDTVVLAVGLGLCELALGVVLDGHVSLL